MKSNIQAAGLSRRSFLKTSAGFTLGAAGAGCGLAATLEARGRIALVVAPDDGIAASVPAVWALGELEQALVGQGTTVRRVARLGDAAADEFCVVVGGMAAALVQTLIQQKKTVVPAVAEALCLMSCAVEGRAVLLAAGADALGLVYALSELAERVRCAVDGRAALEFALPVIEQPASRTRSVMRAFSSEVEDKSWFYARDFWRSYLTLLVTMRVNRFSFATGMGYNSAANITDGYLIFPYPFLVAVAGHDVRARGLADEERARNLAMLQFIGAECARRGLRFQLGIWTLAYQWPHSPRATYQTEGLTDASHAAYCRDALAVVLRQVPEITGVTFRVHSESGIPKGQENFWLTQFSAIAQCGRRVEIDMHAKNMTPETLELALATGQPVVVSPKYCGEHLGLPYHQSAIRDKEMAAPDKFTDTGTGILTGDRSFTRYGYADTLAENRGWDVVFRIWPGTQRLLLSGDPALFAGYGRNASFCGAAGIELCEPLHFKGRQGSGLAGGRCGYADATLAPRYDFEKYRHTYQLWSRLGYNPECDPEVWRRDLRRTFGSAAAAVENALARASRVLPLITLAHGPSADCTRYWPEIYTNMPVTDAGLTQPYRDTRAPGLFGNASSFDPQLFASPDEAADVLLDGRATGQYSPLEVAQWLGDLAESAAAELVLARSQLGDAAAAPAFRRIEEDVLILCGIARFFAGKFRAAVFWRIHTRTGAAGDAALACYTAGLEAWAAMAARAKEVYRADLTFGGAGTIRGHWLDRLPAIDADLAAMRAQVAAPARPADRVPAEDAIHRAIQQASRKPERPTVDVRHTPAGKFQSGQPLVIALQGAAARRVVLHYRHVNQAERWQALELGSNGDGFRGEIPATYTARRFALQYYFEIETGLSDVALYPPLAADLANVPYFVVSRA